MIYLLIYLAIPTVLLMMGMAYYTITEGPQEMLDKVAVIAIVICWPFIAAALLWDWVKGKCSGS